jgi:hypothetical protein
MKRPNKYIIEKWGGDYPPAFFEELCELLIRSQFTYQKTREDAALCWVSPCNRDLSGQVTLIVAPNYTNGLDVACTTFLTFNSEKIQQMLMDAMKSSIAEFGTDFERSAINGRANIAWFNINRYEGGRFQHGKNYTTAIRNQRGLLATSAWSELYHRIVLPLMDTLGDNDRLLDLLGKSPSLTESRSGEAAWHSLASPLFAAFICLSLGRLSEALQWTAVRNVDMLPDQIKDLDAARQYLLCSSHDLI